MWEVALTDRRPTDAASALSIADAQALFSPETVWLNTASYGLPPRPAWEALQAAADEWRHGRCGFDGWDRSVGADRNGGHPARRPGRDTPGAHGRPGVAAAKRA